MSSKKLSLVTDDMKKMICSCLPNARMRNFEFDCMNRFNIGRVIVRYPKGGKAVVELPESVGKAYMTLWKNDVGSVLVSELKKESPELYELVTASFRVLLKRISDDELESFKEKGFVHLVLADSSYTILKAVGAKKSYSESSDDYDLEEDYIDDESSSQIIEQEPSEYEQPSESNSFELF